MSPAQHFASRIALDAIFGSASASGVVTLRPDPSQHAQAQRTLEHWADDHWETHPEYFTYTGEALLPQCRGPARWWVRLTRMDA